MTKSPAPSERPIGVFDSGMGGLSVLKALRHALPAEDFVYLGDTARLPYGTKSAETVASYALQAAKHLSEYQVKLVVIACNTASSVALPALMKGLDPLPVLGVVEPGARAAVRASKNGIIAVIGTESTIMGGAYERAIMALKPEARVVGRPAQLFVALAEEGWIDGEETRAIARRYLHFLIDGPLEERADTLVLGCTHFPALLPAIRAVLGPEIALVDSADTTAQAVEDILGKSRLVRPAGRVAHDKGRLKVLVTDSPQRFARVGSLFLGAPLAEEDIELIDL
jgi:glutamate racemase